MEAEVTNRGDREDTEALKIKKNLGGSNEKRRVRENDNSKKEKRRK